jgi:predicted Zn-dependent peptidase
MKIKIRFPATLALIFVLTVQLAMAGTYSPPGLYNPIIYKLENGLQVVLKPRPDTRSVSIRLVVGLGSRHVSCEKNELPHLIEHLLFMGTEAHTETELDDLIESNGGQWNAVTDLFSTTYEVDIYSGRAKVAVDTLSEIFEGTKFDEELFSNAQDVVEIEAGGSISFAGQLAQRYGLLQTGSEKAMQRLNILCPQDADPQAVSLNEALDAFTTYYTPNNMTFIAAGNLEPAEFGAWIEATFGRLAAGDTLVPQAPLLNTPEAPIHVSSSLSPIFGASVETSLLWRIPTEEHADYWALWVASEYMGRELYQTLRTERAESYSPSAGYINYGEWALFELYADGTSGTENVLEQGMLDSLEKIGATLVETEVFESVKMAILLSSASGLESNASFASYYADRLPQLKTFGRYLDEESYIEKVTLETMQAAMRRWLLPENRLTVYEVPTLQVGDLVLPIFGVAGLMAGALFLRYRRFANRRR